MKTIHEGFRLPISALLFVLLSFLLSSCQEAEGTPGPVAQPAAHGELVPMEESARQQPAAGPLAPEQEAFWARLMEHCGNAYAGDVVNTTPYYEGTRNYERLVAHWWDCSGDRIHIAVHVDDNRSRNWLLTREEGTILLKHDHRDEDGNEEAFTQYGGPAPVPGLPHRQIFLADEHTGQIYPERSDNFWFMHFVDETGVFAYGVHWPKHGHSIRREFDLSSPVDPPPAPWGY